MDSEHELMQRHAKKRLALYRQLGYEIKEQRDNGT